MDDNSKDVLKDFHNLQKSTAEVNWEIKSATARIAEKLKTLDEIADPPDYVNEGQFDMINNSFDTLQTSEHEELLNELIRWTKGTKVNFEEYDYDYLNQVESWQQFYTKSLEEKVDGLEQQIGTFDGYLDQMKDKIDYFHNKMGEFFSMLPTDGPYGIMYHQFTPGYGNIGPRGNEQDKIKIYEAQIKCFSDALKKLQELLQGASAEIKKLKQCEADTRKKLDDLKNDFEKLRQANQSKDDIINKLKDEHERERELQRLCRLKLDIYKSPAIEFSIGGENAANSNENRGGNESSGSQSRSSTKKRKSQHDNNYDEDDEYTSENGTHHRKSKRSRNLSEFLSMAFSTQNVFEIGEEEIAKYNEKTNQNNDQSNLKSVEDDEKYKELLEQIKKMEDENKSLKDTVEASSSDDELKKLIEKLTKERDDLANHIHDIEEKSKNLQSKLDEAEKEKEKLNTKLQESEKENEKLNTKLQESEKEKENLTNKLDEIVKENEKLNHQINDGEKEKEELKKMLNQADCQIQNINQKIQTLKDELEKAQEDNDRKSNELQNLNKEELNQQLNDSNKSEIASSIRNGDVSFSIVYFEKTEMDSDKEGTDTNIDRNGSSEVSDTNKTTEAENAKVSIHIDDNSIFHYDCSMVLNSQFTQTDLSSSEIFDKTTYEKAEQPNYQYQSTQIDFEPYPIGIDNVVFYEVKRNSNGGVSRSSRNDYLSNDDNFIAIRSPHSSSINSLSSFNNNNGDNNAKNPEDLNDTSRNIFDEYEEDENEIHPPFHVKVQYTPTNKNFKKLWLPKPPSSATPSNSPRFRKSGERKSASARADLLNASIDSVGEGRKSMLAPMLGNPPFAEMSAEFRPRYPLLVVQSLNKPPLGGYRIDSDDVSAFRRRNSGHVIIVPKRLSSLRKKAKDKEDSKKNNSDNEIGAE